MRSISKAIIAVMIAAAMCVVPLFVIEDSEAITVTTGEKAVSFSAGSITDEKFDGLVTQTYKNRLVSEAISAIVPDSYDWSFDGTPTVKNVKDVKLALGNSVSDGLLKNVSASKITFDVVVTLSAVSSKSDLFTERDGTQDLYKELGISALSAGSKITIEGTVTLDSYEYTEISIVKNTAGNYVTKELTVEHSTSESFDGKVKVVSLDKTYELKTKNASGGKAKMVPDYYNADKIEDVTLTSKVLLNVKTESGGAVEQSFNYKIADKSGGYDDKMDTNAIMRGIGYYAGTVESVQSSMMLETPLLFDTNIEPMPVCYYDPLGTPMEDCFFGAGMVSIADPTNEKVKTYLDDIGDISDSYSDAKSNADGAYSPVSAGGSGNNNIIFYVIIGVLAVAVVALAVLMIKKK